ncbi:MAG: alpha/beta hydrolase [Thiolinea sp.]
MNLSYAIDQRAEGMLDCAIEHRHRHEDAVTELSAWVDWLKQEGAGKVAVWGHSRGGNQVAWFASEHDSELISQYILVAPATYSAEEATASYEQRYGASLSELMAKAQELSDAGKGDELMEVPGFVYCEGAKASADAFLSYGRADERKHTPNLLGKITKPTLLVIGSADDVVADLPEQLKDFSQDNIQVATIDGADHFFRDLYADEMAEMIEEFLAW